MENYYNRTVSTHSVGLLGCWCHHHCISDTHASSPDRVARHRRLHEPEVLAAGSDGEGEDEEDMEEELAEKDHGERRRDEMEESSEEEEEELDEEVRDGDKYANRVRTDPQKPFNFIISLKGIRKPLNIAHFQNYPLKTLENGHF